MYEVLIERWQTQFAFKNFFILWNSKDSKVGLETCYFQLAKIG